MGKSDVSCGPMKNANETGESRSAEDGTSSLVNTLNGYGLREGMDESIEPLRRPSNSDTNGLNEEDFNTFMEADGIVSK